MPPRTARAPDRRGGAVRTCRTLPSLDRARPALRAGERTAGCSAPFVRALERFTKSAAPAGGAAVRAADEPARQRRLREPAEGLLLRRGEHVALRRGQPPGPVAPRRLAVRDHAQRDDPRRLRLPLRRADRRQAKKRSGRARPPRAANAPAHAPPRRRQPGSAVRRRSRKPEAATSPPPPDRHRPASTTSSTVSSTTCSADATAAPAPGRSATTRSSAAS